MLQEFAAPASSSEPVLGVFWFRSCSSLILGSSSAAPSILLSACVQRRLAGGCWSHRADQSCDGSQLLGAAPPDTKEEQKLTRRLEVSESFGPETQTESAAGVCCATARPSRPERQRPTDYLL